MMSGTKMEKSKICQGPKDPNLYSCRHVWSEFVEKGAKDNQTYVQCKHCGLICPILKGGEYPPECIEHRIKQFCSDVNSINPKLNPSLVKEQNEQKKKFVNAKDFRDPRTEGCGECEQD